MEEFKKYPKIRQLGHSDNADIFLDPSDEIFLQEKMDGANMRFMIKDGNIIFGSRTQQLTSDKGDDDNVAKNFKRCVEHIRSKLLELEPSHLNSLESYIFFGECMVRHTMPYDWEKIPPFLGFDIYKIKDEVFMNQDVAKQMFEEMGLSFVPILKVVKGGEITEFTDNDVPISAYASPSSKDQQAEGVVFKNDSKQIYAKYVRLAFKEANAETFGGTPKYEETGAGLFVAKYCPNPRIDKAIFKLIDDGHKLDMPLMKHLPNMVYMDMWIEHWDEIVDGKKIKSINFKKAKKLVTRRCLSVLRQVLVNTQLNRKS